MSKVYGEINVMFVHDEDTDKIACAFCVNSLEGDDIDIQALALLRVYASLGSYLSGEITNIIYNGDDPLEDKEAQKLYKKLKEKFDL